jgi:hypothetical protein
MSKKNKSKKVVESVEIPSFAYSGSDWPGTEKHTIPEKQMDLVSGTFVHVDEYIDDKAQPECLRKFLERARSPAHGRLSSEPYPKLFATYQGQDWMGVKRGDRVRVVMASRLGDVGCTTNLNAESGYQIRTSVDNLSDFSEHPF